MAEFLFPIFLGLLFVAILSWLLYFRHFHVGFGAALSFRESDKAIVVISRLLDSPSGKAEVPIGARIVSIDAQLMKFRSGEEFQAWGEGHKPALGRREVWVLSDGRKVQMEPVKLKRRIPVYWNPNIEDAPNMVPGLTIPGLEWCRATGQYVKKGRLAAEAVQAAFF